MSFLLSHAVVRLCNWQRSNVLADWTKNPGQTADFRKPARTKAKKEDVSEETRTYCNPNLNQCFASLLLKILMHIFYDTFPIALGHCKVPDRRMSDHRSAIMEHTSPRIATPQEREDRSRPQVTFVKTGRVVPACGQTNRQTRS